MIVHIFTVNTVITHELGNFRKEGEKVTLKKIYFRLFS